MSQKCQMQPFGIELAARRFLPSFAISRHPILGEPVPWLIGKTSRCFLLNLPLAPDWSADVPFSLFFSEVGSEARWNVILRVPDSHNLHVLDRGIFDTRVMARLVACPYRHVQSSYRPLN